MAKILIIEDDEVVRTAIRDWLLANHHLVETTGDGIMAADLLKVSSFDVVVLDWNLPGKNGIDILREFREGGGQTPVLMLTANDRVDDKELGLDYGADDYLTKPFAIKELAARIRALLRRSTDMVPELLTVGDIRLDSNKHRLTKAGKEVHLQPRDFSLLEFFMRYPNKVFNADALLTKIWASDTEATPEAIRTSIKRIRQALDDGADLSESIIRTIPRVGYTLKKD